MAAGAMVLTLPWSAAPVPAASALVEPLTPDGGDGGVWTETALVPRGAATFAVLPAAILTVSLCTWVPHTREG